MRDKWYIISLFLLLFIVFGAFQEQNTTPNQEIVLEFVDGKINNQNKKHTITEVKEKLLKAGVKSISVKETKTGVLKISYYSIFNANHIKLLLAKEVNLVLDENEKEDSSNKYNLNVYELNDFLGASNPKDKYLLEIKLNSDRFTNPIAFIKSIELPKDNPLFTPFFKVNKSIVFTKERTSYQEPETRAGPLDYSIKKTLV